MRPAALAKNTASGLNITISPEEGISNIPGSRVVISGLNKKSKVEVIANFKDGVQKKLV